MLSFNNCLGTSCGYLNWALAYEQILNNELDNLRVVARSSETIASP